MSDRRRPDPTSCHLVWYLVVTGELDLAAAPRVLRHVERLIDPSAGTITLELGYLDFIDAAGVRCLLTAKRLVEAAGGRLVATLPAARVHRVLELCGVCEALGLPAFTPDEQVGDDRTTCVARPPRDSGGRAR